MADLNKYLAPGEDWPALCDRVSGIMMYRDGREELREALEQRKLIFNSPAMINAGRPGGRSLTACNLLKVPDSIEGIFETVAQCATIFKSGGGVGLDLSALSPAGTALRYRRGLASGPVSFLRNFNVAGESILAGGLRRAAIMGTYPAEGQDARRFIQAKENVKDLENFNLSLTYEAGPDSAPADVYLAHVRHAWENGEPGIVFLDHVNKGNPVLGLYGPIWSVNACSEQPLYPNGSCTLGHVNLVATIEHLGDYAEFERVVALCVRALDRIIDINHYPLPAIRRQARLLRRIGCGLMGWGDLLTRHDIPFAHPDALDLVHEIGEVWQTAAIRESMALANRFGGYREDSPMRNVGLTTIAPTGHTADLVGVSKSIYPRSYGLQLEMTIEEHLDLLAAWQPYVDSAISYTVCFPHDAPVSTVDRIFRGAWDREIKCVTVYRDRSRPGQPCCTADGECGATGVKGNER